MRPFSPRAKLTTQLIEGEMVIHVGPETLVASKSEPGVWHVVDRGTCTCAAWEYRQTCRHLLPAALAAETDRENAKADEPKIFAHPPVRSSFTRQAVQS